MILYLLPYYLPLYIPTTIAYPLIKVAQDTSILLQQLFIISKLSLSHMQHTIKGRMAYAPIILRLQPGHTENNIKGEHLSAAN